MARKTSNLRNKNAAEWSQETKNKDVKAQKKKEKKQEDEDEMEYGDVADTFVENSSDDDSGSGDEDEDDVEKVGGGDDADDDDDDDDDDEEDDESKNDSDSDDDSEEYDEVDVTAALFQGGEVQQGSSGTDDDSSEQEDDGDDAHGQEDKHTESSPPSSAEPYTFDLRNMLAINTDQLATGSLYSKGKKKENASESFITIPLDTARGGLAMNEEFLLSKATAGCTQLIRALWQLPTEQSDAGPLVTLPSYDEVRLPRALPPPPPKQETKWEKFAKAKGISLNKEKRSRKVWDEATQSWMYRHGYEKANKKDKEWPIMELGPNDDPNEDPWEKLREAKRARVDKNIASRMKNEERAGNLAKGATNRVMKGREKAYKLGKEAGRKDQQLPVGVPVDLKESTGVKETNLRGKTSTMAALSAVQRSTASLGKFDKMREDEPERAKVLSKMKKRKFESATDRKVMSSEGEKSMKILKAVMNGGGVAKEKAIRKGQLATGETAYDYDFNDGLGASSFKKKKGRAGAGKMKKMTKKRAK